MRCSGRGCQRTVRSGLCLPHQAFCLGICQYGASIGPASGQYGVRLGKKLCAGWTHGPGDLPDVAQNAAGLDQEPPDSLATPSTPARSAKPPLPFAQDRKVQASAGIAFAILIKKASPATSFPPEGSGRLQAISRRPGQSASASVQEPGSAQAASPAQGSSGPRTGFLDELSASKQKACRAGIATTRSAGDKAFRPCPAPRRRQKAP